MIFEGLSLDQLEFSKYGTLKFHGIVEEEIAIWKRKYALNKKHKKVEKFGLELVENALKVSRNNKFTSAAIPEVEFDLMVMQYEALAKEIESKSSPPTPNDWKVLAYSEKFDQFMVTNDDIVYKVGKRIINEKSLELEDLVRNLYKDSRVTRDQVESYSQKLEKDYGELFKISKVLK